MTQRKLDHGVPVRGTQPLSRSTSLPLPQQLPVTPPQPTPKPAVTADANAAAARKHDLPSPRTAIEAKRQELSDKKLQLAQLRLSVNAKRAEAEEKKEAAAKQPLWKRALNGLADTVSDSINGFLAKAKEEISDLGNQISRLEREIAEALETGSEIVNAGIQEFRESRAEGQSLLDSVKDSARVAGKKTYTDVIDPRLDRSVLGADDEYQDQGVGALGPVLTNRLAVGESVSIRIDAGTTLPLEAFGIPNAKLDAGGTLKLTRIAKLDANGQIVMEPKDANGNPPSELKVTMELEGRAGASYSARVGFDATAKMGRYEAGLKASAGAEAEAGLKGRVAFAFAFDPGSTEDMDVLTGMMRLAGSSGAESAIPGIGAALTARKMLDSQDLIAAFGAHLYSIDGEGGLYGQATANASAKAGIFKGKSKKAEAEEAEAPQSFVQKMVSAGKDYAAGKVQEKAEEIEKSLLDELQVQIGSLSASMGGEATIGGNVNFRTGERTLTLTLDGKARGSLNLLGIGGSEAIGGNRTVALTYDKDGNLKGVKLQTEMSKEKFVGIQTTVEDIFGRPIDSGVIAQVGTKDSVRVTYDLLPSEVAKVAQAMKTNPLTGIGYAAVLPIDKETVMIKDRAVLAIKKTTAEFKVGFNFSLGAEVGLRGGVSFAHEQETVLTN